MTSRRGNMMKSNFGNRNLPPTRQLNPWMSGSESTRFTSNVPDPQTQLALASNLINNLLNPGQQSSPPSLLSLGNLASPQNFGAGTGSIGNLSRYGNLNQGNFGRNRFGPSRDYGKRDVKGAFRRSGADQNRSKFQGRRNEQNKNKTVDESKKSDTDNTADNSDIKMEKDDDEVAGDEDDEKKDESKAEESEKADSTRGNEFAESVEDYTEIAPCLLYCHICRKHMWDAESFVKHLDGRPHKLMIDELDQSYKLIVELLRHETRVMEQQRENDIQRAQRKGKAALKTQQRGFCTMCDLNFMGTLPAHRRNERHQRLKKFLHPKCNLCDKEFYTRLEWDDHKLSAAHLKNLHQARLVLRPNVGTTEFDIVDFIEDVNDAILMCNIDVKVDGVRKMYTDEEQKIIDEQKEILEKGKDDDKEKERDENRYPKFVNGTAIGAEFVATITGSLCRACYRFMPTEEDAKVHLQSQAHYNSVVQLLKIKDRIAPPKIEQDTKVEAETTEEDSGAVAALDKEQEDIEEEQSVEEPSTKRRKVEQDEEDEEMEVNGAAVEDDKSEEIEAEQEIEPEKPTAPVKSARNIKTSPIPIVTASASVAAVSAIGRGGKKTPGQATPPSGRGRRGRAK